MSRSETAIFTNMCMIYDDDDERVLVQDRLDPNWPGITFPGGHVNKFESFSDSVIREVYEETGLTIETPILCGIKQFHTKNDERYVVLLYKTNKFSGKLKSSKEGNVFWIKKQDIYNYELAPDFEKMLQVFEDDNFSELYYYRDGETQHSLLL